MLPDSILPTPEDDIARILRDYERRLSHLETLEQIGGAWTLIEEIQLSVAAPTIDFQNIPATHAHLLILGSLRSAQVGASAASAFMRFNNSAVGYDFVHALISHNAVLVTAEGINAAQMGIANITAGNAAANTFGAVEWLIPDYTDSTKLVSARAGSQNVFAQVSTNIRVEMGGGTWRTAGPVNRVTLLLTGGNNYVAGSFASLYGVR